MSSEQPAVLLHEEPRNPGEVTLPDDDIAADNLLKELQEESLDVDELVSIADGLSQMETELGDRPDGDTLSEPDTYAINVAVEQFILAAKLEPKQVFAMETMHSYAGRRAARKIALESVVSTIKTIMEKIIAFIRKLINFLYDTMQELLYGADMVLKAAQELQERARGIAHKSLAEGNFVLGDKTLALFFSKGKQLYSPEQVLTTYVKYTAAMKASFSSGFIKEMGLRVEETLKEAKNNESRESTEGKVDKIMRAMVGRTFSGFQSVNESDGHEVRELQLPFGQRRLVLLLSKENNLYSGYHIDIATIQGQEPAETAELETMDYSQIIKLAKAVENEMLFGLFKSYRSSKADLDRIRSNVERGCNEIARMQQGTNRNSTGLSYSVSFLKDLAKSLVTAVSKTHRYDILVARHVLMYCDRSIKRYE